MIKKITAFFLVLVLCFTTMPLEAFAEAYSEGIKNGKIYFDEESGTVYKMDDGVTEVNIPSSIGGVPVKNITYENNYGILSGALAGANLKKASFAEGIEYLWNGTFWGCTALESVSLPESLKRIEHKSFCGCIRLKNITIPGNVELIGGNAFQNCKSLETVTLSEGIGEIAYGAFSGCNKLKEIKLPSTINYLADDIFEECTSLTKVVIPKNISEIGEGAFYGCDKLESVVMEEGVVSIEDSAFRGCTSLEKVVCPRSLSYISGNDLTYLGNSAFDDNTDTVFYVYKDSYAAEALQGRTLYYIDGTPEENEGINEEDKDFVKTLRNKELADDFEDIDLFGKNLKYLSNEEYRLMFNEIYAVTDDITWARSKFSEIKAIVKSLLKDSWVERLKRTISGYTGLNFTEHEIEEEVAFDLVYSLGEDMKSSAELTADSEEDAEYISMAYSIAETGLGIAEERDSFVELVSNHSGLSKRKVKRVIKDTEKCFEDSKKALRFAKVGLDTVNTVLIGADMLRIQEETVDVLLKRSWEKSYLHYGLSRLDEKQKKIWSKNVIEELFTDNVLNVVDEFVENGTYALVEHATGTSTGLTVAAVDLAFQGLGYIIPDADYEKIYRAMVYSNTASTLHGACKQVETDLIVAYRNNDIAKKEQLKREYEIIRSAIFTNLRKTVDSCLNIADKKDRKRLEEVYYPYEKYMNYETFIFDCMNNAREGIE